MLASHEAGEDEPGAPDVELRCRLLAVDDLRRDIRKVANQLARAIQVFGEVTIARQAEVDELHQAVEANDDVGGRYVAVHQGPARAVGDMSTRQPRAKV